MGKTAVSIAIVIFAMVGHAFAADKTETTFTAPTKFELDAEISSFCKAIVIGDLDTVKKMIELGEDVNRKSLGMTPAIFAARYNRVEILKLLIAKGADLTQKSDNGWTINKHAELSNAKDALAVILENV